MGTFDENQKRQIKKEFLSAYKSMPEMFIWFPAGYSKELAERVEISINIQTTALAKRQRRRIFILVLCPEVPRYCKERIANKLLDIVEGNRCFVDLILTEGHSVMHKVQS